MTARRGRRGRLCTAAVLLTGLAAFRGAALAGPVTVHLDYAASAGCPNVGEFEAAVVSRLGYQPFHAGAEDRVLVRIEPRGGTFDGRIEWRDAAGKWFGEQTFPAVTTGCASLVRAMSFALAVQLQMLSRVTGAARAGLEPPDVGGQDPGGGASVAAPSGPRAQPETASAGPSPPAPVVPETAVPNPPTITGAPTGAQPSPSPGAPAAFAIGLGPALGFGMASRPLPLGRLFGLLAWRHVSVEVAALVSLPATTRRADGAGFSQRHLLGSAAACATVERWNGCVIANAGQVRMSGEDIEHPTSANVPVLAVGARAAFQQPLGSRAFLRVYADGLVNVTRLTATLDRVPVWTAPRLAASLGLDAGVQFR